MFQGKKILLGVTGSIAAYKSLLLVRLLIKGGATVKVILTPAAKDFVTPLSLSTLSKNPVLTGLSEADTWSDHVALGRWADLMLIAPLSCNTLAKMANGLCDNLLLATYLSATCPVVVAPAMDEDMWLHPATKANLEKIRAFGNTVIPVEKGELASGLYGNGRMAEPETIGQFILGHFLAEGATGANGKGNGMAGAPMGGEDKGAPGSGRDADAAVKQDLAGKRALVTAGPTYEAIDPVRFIGNHSSGKMGIAIARELARRGALVDLVLGPSPLEADSPGVTVQRVESAEEMYMACLGKWPAADIAIMAAAVADYSPATPSKEKIKKTKDNNALVLELTKTKDILRTLGEQKKKGQVLAGFALETSAGREYALDKLRTKHADLIVLNTMSDAGAGFGYDTNKITIFEAGGQEFSYEQKPKQQVARDIVDRVVNRLYA
ncbi:MAG TPA: bifunctional phosphopantothenoylcysteine decarboxylase/phosphopantothenate synthase [Puia sp.]|nr:bifunctional phosphopantothenoylcysteine decarboxylase/phosphopantothenate synthase [Puia sp.]